MRKVFHRGSRALFGLVLVFSLAPAPAASASSNPPQIAAASGILIDSSDGRVLWEKNSRSRQSIASTTKILTALIVLEKTKLEDRVRVTANSERVGEGDTLITELELTAGENLSVQQLLYGMLLPSANDAAVALAEHVSRSTTRFAQLMNQRAKQLGAVESHFTNPSGFDDPSHYSTAKDLAIIARAAMKNKVFRTMVATKTSEVTGGTAPRRVVNRNQLLGSFPGADGIKTGQTRASGKALVGSAQRETEERISVVLGSVEPVGESRALLDFGFSGFRRFTVVQRGGVYAQLTYGDGTTAKVIGLADASTLVPASEPNPRTTFDSAMKVVRVQGEAIGPVPMKVSCPSTPCVQNRGQGWLARFLSLFAPAMLLTK